MVVLSRSQSEGLSLEEPVFLVFSILFVLRFEDAPFVWCVVY